jgi:transposase-like protein
MRNKEIKLEGIRCPVCNGKGQLTRPRRIKGDVKKAMIKTLVDNGYSYREVCTLLDLKSPNAVTRALQEKKHATSTKDKAE